MLTGRLNRIYGGGAITGIYAAQLAALSHLHVITVASPTNFDYLRTMGTTAFVDRHQPPHAILASIASVLREHGGELRYAMDCVSSPTASLCLDALRASAGAEKDKELICLAGNPKADVGHVRVHKISFSTTFYHAPIQQHQSMRICQVQMMCDCHVRLSELAMQLECSQMSEKYCAYMCIGCTASRHRRRPSRRMETPL